jgi:hypothetical protein
VDFQATFLRLSNQQVLVDVIAADELQDKN